MDLRSRDDYQAQLKQLVPSGPAWDDDLYPLPSMVIDAMADGFARVDARANALLSEMFPGSVNELLTDWERVMGLPDPCLGGAGERGERGERVRDVVQRFASVGRQDKTYFVEIAARLGYPNAWIEEWRTPRFRRSRFGASRFGSWDKQFIWTFHLGQRLESGRRYGLSRFGDRFGGSLTDIIECVIRRYAPAHTIVYFDYS